MVPKLSGRNGTGTSFKGALAYYLHDKRLDGETQRMTAARVDWIEIQGLPVRDPEKAAAWMACTAMNQNRLKEAAGIPATGRKSSAHVLAYSLAWHPDEKPGKAEMLRAANESLRVLGAEGRQAVIVAHNDEPHKHVHIVVNRVSAQDGRMLPLSHSKEKLSQWALAYERERGQVFCKAREAREAAQKARQPSQQKTRKQPHHLHTTARAFGRAANDNPGAFDRARAEQRAQDARLSRQSASMRERRLAGKIRNALEAAAHVRISRQDEGNKGWLAAAFNFLRSGQVRRAVLEKAQAGERLALSGQHNQQARRRAAAGRAR